MGMAQYENKCQWTDCPVVPTSTSTSPVPPTTTMPSTTSETMCEVDRNMRACVAQGGSFECQRCTHDITGEPCCSCQGGEDPVTTTAPTLTATTSSQQSDNANLGAPAMRKAGRKNAGG